MSTTSPRVTLLRQIQHGFTLVGFLFVFAGVGGFLFMLITHAQIDPLFPRACFTALLEGLGDVRLCDRAGDGARARCPAPQEEGWQTMNRDAMGDIIKRLMRDLADDDEGLNTAPRCEGCGQRVELAPYELRASNGSVEIVMYCDECRALAALVEADGRDS